jgi:hypothetical protein
VQDSFELMGMRANPASGSLTLLEQAPQSGTIVLENQSDLPLNGLVAEVTAQPADLAVNLELARDSLPGLGQANLNYTLTARTAAAYGALQLRISSLEGATVDIYLAINVEPLRPRLVTVPGALQAGMARGFQKLVEFDVINQGGRAAGPMTISVPDLPWLTVASTNPMPALAPGQTNHVTLLLSPAADLTLGNYTGSLAINSAEMGLSVPFTFRALSEAKGDLLVTAVDEYTYYAEGAPRLAGAAVSIRDSVSQVILTNGLTDINGQFFAAQLPEAYYDLEVTADKHTGYRGTHLLAAGQTNEVRTFLSRQTVTYTWTVEPIEIEDRYQITIETVFETVVPIPVVTVEPSVIDLASLKEEENHLEIKITNYGLIAANNTRLNFPTHPLWDFEPLLRDIGVLPANSSLSIPLTIRRLSPPALALHRQPGVIHPASASGGDCLILATVCWELVCGPMVNTYCATIALPNAREGCGGASTPPTPAGGCVGCGATSTTGTTYYPPTSVSTATPCDPCLLMRTLAVGRCVLKFIELPLSEHAKMVWKCLKAGFTCVVDAADGVDRHDVYKCVKGNLECFKSSSESFKRLFKILKILECTCEILTACRDVPGYSNSAIERAAAVICDFVGLTSPEKASMTPAVLVSDPELSPLLSQAQRVRVVADYAAYLLGSYNWLRTEDADLDALESWMGQFFNAIEDDSEGGGWISASESAAIFALPPPQTVSLQEATNLVERWNRSMDYWNRGIVNLAEVPEGQSTNFIALDVLSALATAAVAALQASDDAGYPDLEYGLAQEMDTLNSFYLNAGAQSQNTCARVKLRIEQEAVISRDAFRATLEIDNSDAARLEQIQVSLAIADANGRDATSLFCIREPELVILTGVDGDGILPPGATGTARWVIIPTSDAAPSATRQYFVSGVFKYVLNGATVSVPLSPVSITVLPNPRLVLKYFHQRDVFGDDPFTEVVEPSIPFTLAVMVQNQGYGLAKNFRITSAQPKIIENEKGLLIDFQIIATEVAGRNLVPSLTADFGDINPGQIVIGRWLMTSTLQGLFTDYQATFEHIDGLGNPRLSLIDDVSIHELIHLVQAGGEFEDGKPDFLVNDVPDTRDLPDTLYLSDGRTNLVQVVEAAVAGQAPSPDRLQTTLTADMPPGWVYLRVAEPSDGQLRLLRVARSDGREIAFGTNVWTTDRTFIGLGRRPLRENILHLLDYDSPGVYTLTYEAPLAVDAQAPESAVAPLPAASYPQIPLAWSGQDEPAGSGLAYFDIYVSQDGGSFRPWLQRTTLNGAIYQGVPGSQYQFYSVATDLAGNREAAPMVPDAQTTVSLSNSPPQLTASPPVTVNEGELVAAPNSATDPDAPAQTLTFSLGPGCPAGARIVPATGLLLWQTSEADGPSTNLLSVIVTDNGIPSLSATAVVQVVVIEVNSPPILDAPPKPTFTINERQWLVFTNRAYDLDLPRQGLFFSLGPGSPAGAVIDPLTGVFSWRPTEIQGPSTNQLLITVSDDGLPSLSATQSVTIVVRDTRPDFELRVGTTNLFAGQTSAVPILLDCGLALKELSFAVQADPCGLVEWNLAGIPPILTATLRPSAGVPSQWEFSFSGHEDTPIHGALTLAQLGFRAAFTNSAIVLVSPQALAGLTLDGQVNTRAAVQYGRVFVIADEPILDPLLSSNQVRSLHLYGKPGVTYGLESKPALDPSTPWSFERNVQLETTRQAIGPLPDTPGQVYYRTYVLTNGLTPPH